MRLEVRSVQKDWTFIEANELPEDFALAVRGHNGWNHKANAGSARYCLAVSFESIGTKLPVYAAIKSVVEVEVQPEIRVET